MRPDHSDLMFITSPAGADPDRALAALPAHTAKIRETAAAVGRELKLVIHPMVICRDTEREAQAYARSIIDHVDPVALENFLQTFAKGDQVSWRGFEGDEQVLGGNVNLIGTPEQVVDWMVRVKAAGCDGVQLSFFDYLPDLEYFGDNVLPLMIEAGLRKPQIGAVS